jgi:hypothetical protein
MRCDQCALDIDFSTKTCPRCGSRVAAAGYGPLAPESDLLPDGFDDVNAVPRLLDIVRDENQAPETVRRASLLLGQAGRADEG